MPAKLEDLSRHKDGIAQAQLRSAERERWFRGQACESVASSPLSANDSVFAKVPKQVPAIFVECRDGDAALLLKDVVNFNANRLLPKLLTPAGVLVDRGAEYDCFSLMAALFACEKRRGDWFEADSTLTPLIGRSVSENGLQGRVRVWSNAASNCSEIALFGFNPVFPGSRSLGQGGSANSKIVKFAVARALIGDLLGEDFVANCMKLNAPRNEAAVLQVISDLFRRAPSLALSLRCERRADTPANVTLEMLDGSAGSEISFCAAGDNRLDEGAQDLAAMPASCLVRGQRRTSEIRAFEVEIYGDIGAAIELSAFYDEEPPPSRWLAAGAVQPLCIDPTRTSGASQLLLRSSQRICLFDLPVSLFDIQRLGKRSLQTRLLCIGMVAQFRFTALGIPFE